MRNKTNDTIASSIKTVVQGQLELYGHFVFIL